MENTKHKNNDTVWVLQSRGTCMLEGLTSLWCLRFESVMDGSTGSTSPPPPVGSSRVRHTSALQMVGCSLDHTEGICNATL